MTSTRANFGFTLLDILLVAAIVSLLSSLFLFQVSEAKKKADDATMQVEAQQVSNAIAVYKNDHNGFVPLTVTGGGNLSEYVDQPQYEGDPNSAYRSTMQTLVDGGYLPKIPTSPSGQSYVYAVSSDMQDAVFIARLNRSSSNSSGGSGNLFCASSNGQSSSPLCSSIGSTLLAESQSTVDPCGLPPYITGYSEQYNSNGSQAKNIQATDSEGGTILFEFEGTYSDYPVTCGITGNTLACSMHPYVENLQVHFGYRTEGCPLVRTYTTLNNPNYNPPGTEYLTLSGGNEQVSLVPETTYEITYSHSSVNASYQLEGSTGGNIVETWFMGDSTLYVGANPDWSCTNLTNGVIAQGETANCINSNTYESLYINDYNLQC